MAEHAGAGEPRGTVLTTFTYLDSGMPRYAYPRDFPEFEFSPDFLELSAGLGGRAQQRWEEIVEVRPFNP